MTALNKQAYRADGGDIGIGRLKEIADNAYSDEEKRWLAQRVLSLLDENLQLQRDKDSLEAVAIAMRDDMRDAREKLEAEKNNLIDSECHVAELEEALRDKQALLVALDNALCELLPGTQYMDPPDGGGVTPLEQVRRMVADYRSHIANLESRKVCVPRISNDEFWLSFNNRIFFREETYRSAVIKSIEAAGIGVKGE